MQLNETSSESNEITSSKKVVVSLLQAENLKKMGEIRVIAGKIAIQADNPEDESYLFDLMRDAWQIQAGIPVIAKKEGNIEYQPDGKVRLLGYASFRNSTADEVLEAFVDYTNLLGIFNAELLPI